MPEIRILIGGELFSEIRRGNYYYVDKTGFLNDFLPLPAKVSCITRPRRFGKTLFLSMLAEFFDITKDSRKLFAGLKVSANEELCKNWMNKYPVIFISLKDVYGNTFSEALDTLNSIIVSLFEVHENISTSVKIASETRAAFQTILHRQADKSLLWDSLGILTGILTQYYGSPAVVLIDEYDVPLAMAEENGYYDEMIQFMRGFLSYALKTNQNNVMFAILTGCLSLSNENIFTGLNNLKYHDISDDKFADVFGFTQEEVDRLLDDAGLSSRKKLKTGTMDTVLEQKRTSTVPGVF